MKRPVTNVADSVRAKLLALAKKRGDDFTLTLVRYVNERLVVRLAASTLRADFVLKGAALFSVWTDSQYRATRDLDFLGRGTASASAIRSALGKVLGQTVEDDGVQFDLSSLKVEAIREAHEYGGFRATLTARLGVAKVPVQVDVGFGDAVTPRVEDIEFPTLLGSARPSLRAYPRETVVAEKVEALVSLGLTNTG